LNKTDKTVTLGVDGKTCGLTTQREALGLGVARCTLRGGDSEGPEGQTQCKMPIGYFLNRGRKKKGKKTNVSVWGWKSGVEQVWGQSVLGNWGQGVNGDKPGRLE